MIIKRIFNKFRKKSILARMKAMSLKELIECCNQFSLEEWQEVVDEAAKRGYDISYVLEDKKREGDSYDVFWHGQILEDLLEIDGELFLVHQEYC